MVNTLSSNTTEMEFFYDEHLIGRIYNLSEHDCERAMDMWHELGEAYWCTISIFMDGD